MAETSVHQRCYDKKNPFPARIVENRVISGPGSQNETRHFVLDISGSGLTYTVGDSLGVFPTNHPLLVDEIVEAIGVDGDDRVLIRGDREFSFREALLTQCSITQPSRKVLELLQSVATSESDRVALAERLAPEAKAELAQYLAERELIDVLQDHPSARPEAQALVDCLARLNPRLYSIASSPRVHGEHIHLLVAVVRYETNNRNRFGVCSTFKADRVQEGVTPVPVFVAHSHFGLPDDDTADVIMIGPGTGVAPFRAFLHERRARGATGRNWLFFGGQREKCDFLYGDEFLAAREEGLLTRLDLAFSRDQPKKIYVQDRLREHAAEVWDWIRNGAYFYVCGDAKRMAKSVDQALRDIVAEQGGMSAEAATDYVKALRRGRRYQRDVY